MPENPEGLVVNGKILQVPQAWNIHDTVSNILSTDTFNTTVTSSEEREKINGYWLVRWPSLDYSSFGFHINGVLYWEGVLSYGDNRRGTAKYMKWFFEGGVLRKWIRLYGNGTSKEWDFYPGTDFLHGKGKYIVTKGSVGEWFVTDSILEGEFYRDELVNWTVTDVKTWAVKKLEEDTRNFMLRRQYIILNALELLQEPSLGKVSEDMQDLRGKFVDLMKQVSEKDGLMDDGIKIELRKLITQIQNTIYQSSVLWEKNGLANKPLWQEIMPKVKSLLIDFATKLF